ncbi:arylamine N-acetyltransferase family protein [Nitrosomonas eutropha]|uniref:arylamine N-acetyltransferase family protein n=1 Tax=Nitrosomonas eutropha TaxID=916 RepID=UPI0008B9E7CD|nr:arylamine N-acetyltransferase [Nitrosomonas eutropha]SEI82228.1 N-hydroxyarylamine O-acetyltransferase [Nitrosomonas eutropha]
MNKKPPVCLSQYFERIGYQGAVENTLEVLHALTRAHTQTIPFENLDVFLKKPIHLETEALFNKLVLAKRGGYCFEQNGLFLQILLQLGFKARPLAARVRLRVTDRLEMPARTHLFISVELGGQQWLTDVGVGGYSLTQALLWQENLEQDTLHDRRRLMHEAGRWFHQVWTDNHWLDIYEFWGEEMPASDQKVANWYTSTYPESSFTKQIMAARALPNGGRLSLLDGEFRHRHPDGRVIAHHVPSDKLKNILLEQFAIRWPEE